MFSNLSAGALGLSLDHTTAIELAATHGFGGVDPDLGHLRGLASEAAAAEHGAAVRERGLEWGMAGLPIGLDAPAAEFREALVELPEALALLRAAGVTRVGTWIRPMHEELDHRQNWRLHLGRLSLVAEILDDAGLRLGLEYIGPKTLWSTERFPFVHSLREARELIAETGAGNVGLILDSYHWYTAGEGAADLAGLTDAEIISVDINDARSDRERDEQQDLDRRLPYDTGVIDLEGFMGAVHAAGYSGPVKVEPFLAELAEQPVDEVLADISRRLTARSADARAQAAGRRPASTGASSSATISATAIARRSRSACCPRRPRGTAGCAGGQLGEQPARGSSPSSSMSSRVRLCRSSSGVEGLREGEHRRRVVAVGAQQAALRARFWCTRPRRRGARASGRCARTGAARDPRARWHRAPPPTGPRRGGTPWSRRSSRGPPRAAAPWPGSAP